jgi:hypothetical protein
MQEVQAVRNLFALATAGDDAARKTAPDQAGNGNDLSQTGACCGVEALKTPLAPVMSSEIKALLQAESAGARPISREQGGVLCTAAREQGAILGQNGGSKALTFAQPAEVTAYLCGFAASDGHPELIRPGFWRNPHQWGVRRLAELAERVKRAQQWDENSMPAFDEPVPTGAELARQRRLYQKGVALRWEWWLLRAWREVGRTDPADGFLGLRVYQCANDDLAAQLLREVVSQMNDGAPGTWHGRHIVQLAEADWVAVLDHPAVRYA